MTTKETQQVIPFIAPRDLELLTRLRVSGVLVDNAMALVASPPWSAAQMEGYLEKALEDILKVGLTSVHDAASLPEYIEVFSQYVFVNNLAASVLTTTQVR